MQTAGLIGATVRKRKVFLGEGEQFARASVYGELYAMPMLTGRVAAALEGSYFVATNPTPGTAVASAVNASFDATKSFIAIRNKDVPGGKYVIPDYIKIIPTVAPASGTSMHFAIFTDVDAKYTSAGTEYTPQNINSESPDTPVSTVVVTSGAAMLVTVASTKLKARGVARSVIPAVLEEIVIRFGGEGASGSSASAAGRSEVMVPPIIIAPGHVMLLNAWFPSNSATGISLEFEVGLIER